LTRTFIDAGVLIAAARGTDEVSHSAMQVLDDPERVYITSDLVRLEVLPKAIYNKREAEAEFYRTFFERVERLVMTTAALVAQALAEANRHGLSAIDALHIAAAKAATVEEFVTVERATKPLFRVTDLRVITLLPTA
jgi:predicted nucleic acid-binding protein